MEEKKNWSWIPEGGLIPEQTDQLTVGCKIIFAFGFGGVQYGHESVGLGP
jgi:hypothetical protein